MASPPPLPKPATQSNGRDERIPSSRVLVPRWRWVVAILLAPVIFLFVQFLMLFVFGQTIAEVPESYNYVVDVAGLALPLGITLMVLRGFIWPKPPKPSNERGFPVMQNRADR